MQEIAPKRKFGQNFLTDQSVVERIVSTAGNLENKCIIEIGGGSGNLTKQLLKAKPKKLLVIEIDKASGEIIKSWGSNLFIMPHGLEIDKEDLIYVKVDKAKKISAYIFLRAIGLTDLEIFNFLCNFGAILVQFLTQHQHD